MPSDATINASGLSAGFQPDIRQVRSSGRGRHRKAKRVSPVIFLATDGAAFAAAVFLSQLPGQGGIKGVDHTLSRAIDNAGALGPAWHGWGVILLLVVVFSYLSGRNHYDQRLHFRTALRDIVVAGTLALACDKLLASEIYRVPFGVAQVARWAIFIPLVPVFRLAMQSILSRLGLWKLRTIVIGQPSETGRVAAALQSEPRFEYDVAGIVERQALSRNAGRDELNELLNKHNADDVTLVADPNDRDTESLTTALTAARISFSLVPPSAMVPIVRDRCQYLLASNILLVSYNCSLPQPVARIGKRCFDLVVATFLLVGCLPLMLALAWIVRRDGNPALYRHKRLGVDGRVFNCLKFRSMVVDADRALADLLAADPAAAAEWDATQKLRKDPRITPVGRFLRQSSLDELPQLLNVLRGEMSLVGPRPIVAAETRFYGEHIDDYYAIRPGLTGLWQISGRSETTYDRRVELDVTYARNWSLWRDIIILLKTLPAVMLRRGAV